MLVSVGDVDVCVAWLCTCTTTKVRACDATDFSMRSLQANFRSKTRSTWFSLAFEIQNRQQTEGFSLISFVGLLPRFSSSTPRMKEEGEIFFHL